MNILENIIKNLTKSRVKTRADLNSLKKKFSKKYKIPCPSNIELLKAYHKLVENKRLKDCPKLEALLKTSPVRSLSGIVNIAVLTKPYPCPGKCVYCPLEKGIPKSYLSGEPAVERAKSLNYNPYSQVKKRIEMLEAEGHQTDKIELRVIGGTWSYYPKQYQKWFVMRCFQACNNTSRPQISNFQLLSPSTNGRSGRRDLSLRPPISKQFTNYELQKLLKREQRLNEKARHRIVGISIETRPDFINSEEIKFLRELGVTMVELGVQSIYDDVLEKNKRGHSVKEIITATKLLKDAGFKVLYQMMLNLLGSDLKRDEKMFEELFRLPDFQPDYLKIYPCALLKETPLYKLWKMKKYKPYEEKELIELLKSIKKKIPYYVRIQRIVRDIPSNKVISGGAKISNLRQEIAKISKKEGWSCHCIRCREVKEDYNRKEKVYLFREDYITSGGKEIFLSFENKNREKLYSLLRLRLPQQDKNIFRYILPILKNAAIIREIHTYGEMVPISENKKAPQHKGLGKKLVLEAERIVKKESNLEKIAVISGVGVRNYWRRLGYKLNNTYMVKKLKKNDVI